uniref:TPR_REGION domain-containing protein n=1 Tax=Heterorhabditis bacteriophora TaxID=37862 RepID=A0A1I7XLF3_HETBA
MKTCEFRNFTTCLEWAQEGERLCRENKLNQGIECLQKALKIGSEDMRTLSAVYCQLGNAYFSLRNYDKSVEFHSYDMMLARLLKDTSGEAKACGNIGNAFKIQGSFHDALTFTKRQLELSRQIGDKMCEARALYNLGSVYHMKGKQTGRMLKAAAGECSLLSLNSSASQPFLEDLKHAIEYYEENLVLVEEAGDALNCGRTYGNLGNTYYLLRDFETAIQYHYKRLDVARQFGDKSAQRRAYSNLGNAHVFLSQMEKAIEFYRLALMLACEMKDRLAEAQSCFSLANAASLIADHHTGIFSSLY